MTEEEMLARMVPPSQRRRRWRGGILQIHITRACNESCFHCTQASNLGGKPAMMTLDQFEQACDSLQGYFGVVGIFGGCPCMHPKFPEICEIFRSKFEFDQRGLWSNNPMGHGKVCAETFAPWHSNLNVHLDQAAYDEFARDWPECQRYLKGHDSDSAHGSPYVSRADIGLSEDEIAEGTATCEVNQEWSALIGVARGELRAYVCELMYMFSVMHEGDPDWPETGLAVEPGWWQRPMQDFAAQVRLACRHCGMPNKTDGQLAIGGDAEQVSSRHLPWFKPKKPNRRVQWITNRDQIRIGAVNSAIEYIENGSLPRLPIVGQ